MGAQPGLAVPKCKDQRELVHSVLSVNPCERRGHRAQDFKNTQCFCFLFGGAHPLRTGGGGALTETSILFRLVPLQRTGPYSCSPVLRLRCREGHGESEP